MKRRKREREKKRSGIVQNRIEEEDCNIMMNMRTVLYTACCHFGIGRNYIAAGLDFKPYVRGIPTHVHANYRSPFL